jgi:hypothetical protein
VFLRLLLKALMIYIAWIGSVAAYDCKVILLAHYDTAVDENEAPYYLDVTAGGPAFSGYDISSIGKFGAGSLDAQQGAETEMSVWLNSSFDPIDEPFGGDATIEWRMRRPGGLQSTGLGTSESARFSMELHLSNGDILYLTFGYWGSAFPAQDQGAGLRVFTEDGPASSGIYRETGYGWTDSTWHAIRVTLSGGDTVHLHVDGDYKTSVSIGPLATSGVTLDSIVFSAGKTFPTTTDELQIDELRVTLNAALSDATDYVPEVGPWTDETCDSSAPIETPQSSLMLKFDSGLLVDENSTRTNTLTANGSPTAVTTSPQWGTHCAEFNATSNENIDVQSPSDFKATNGEATIDFWFNPTTAGNNTGQGSVLKNALFVTSTSVPIQQHPSSNLHQWWWWNTASGGTFGLSNSGRTVTGITAGVWHHCRVCYYATGEMNIYVDGARLGATTLVAGGPSFDAISIGNQVAAGLPLDGAAALYAWQGRIDSVRIITGTATDPSSAATITVPTADFPNV